MKSVYTDDFGDIDRAKSLLEDSKFHDLDEELPQIDIDVLRETILRSKIRAHFQYATGSSAGSYE